MSFATLSIRRPVLMTVLALGIVLIGAFGAMNLGVREYPNVDSPIITVRTSYTGANAAVVESEVTEIIEASVNSAAGIKSLTSTSSDGRSVIRAEFEVGTDLEAAANDIRDRVSRVQRKLPDEADAPVVYKSDSDSDPILIASLLSDTRDAMELSELASNVVKERLQTIPGVSEVNLWGEKTPVVRLWLDPLRMKALGVSPSDISKALSKENEELPAGKIEGQTMDLSIRTLGRLEKPADFHAIPVKTAADGTIIRLSDVATIHYEPKDTRTGFKRNGKNVIAVALIAQPGSNHVAIADEFYKRVDALRRDLPSDVKIINGMDSSVSIRSSIREVIETIFVSFLLVIAVIFIFLREVRTTFIPMIVIPVSIIGSFFVLYIFGFSINVLTLLAMVLAIGLVVDDAIVIVENIYQKIEKKMSPKEAAVAGIHEIFFAVIATSVVLMAVFVPMLALGGTTGLLFREFVAVMIGTVVISTFCALTLTPMLCSKILRAQKKGILYEKTEPIFEWLNSVYNTLLNGFLRVRGLIFVIIAALLFIAYFCLTNLSSEMAPQEDSNMFMVNISAPEGTGLGQTKKMTEAFVEEMTALMDSSEYEEIQAGARSGGSSMIRVTLISDKTKRRSQSEIARAVQILGASYPDLRVMVFEPQAISTSRGGLPVQFVLQAGEIETLRELLPKFTAEAEKSDVFSVVNADLKFTKPELHVQINRDKAHDQGVSIDDIASTVALTLGDQTYGEFYKDGRQYDVIGTVPYEYRASPSNLDELSVRNASGEMLSVSNFITYSEQSASPSLPRYNRFSAATISAGLMPGKTVGDGVNEMRRIARKVIPDSLNIQTELSGTSKEYEDSSSGLYMVFLLALACIFLVLAGQFESYRSPFVTFFTVPLALAGAIISLYFFGQTLNIFSEIALILLLGLVTKNGILIVEFANQIMERTGCSRLAAAKKSARLRFRPILMTSLSTVLGAVPLILTGTPSRIAMGITIVCGLSFATFLTLFVVPAAYSFFAGKPKKELEKKEFKSGMLLPAMKILPLIFVMMHFVSPNAAAELSPEEAVRTALEKNRTALIYEENVKSANAGLKNSRKGLLPTVDLSLSRYYNYGDTYSKNQAGVKTDIDNDLSHSDAFQIAVNYTVFDGFADISKYNLGKAQVEVAKAELQRERENLIANVLIAYFTAVNAHSSLVLSDSNLSVSRARKKLAQDKFEAGAMTRLDVLSAQMDFASDSAANLSKASTLASAIRNLDELLGGGVIASADDLPDSISVERNPDWKTPEGLARAKERAVSQNAELLSAIASKKYAETNRSGASSSLYPKLNLHGSWNATASEADKGNPAEANSQYFRVGAALSWNLFNGFADNATMESAKIEERSAELKVENVRLNIETNVANAVETHLRALEALEVAEGNDKLASEMLALGEERFKVGRISAFEFRETQSQWRSVREALLAASFAACKAEIQVKQLIGSR